jgi:hypothetical protein
VSDLVYPMLVTESFKNEWQENVPNDYYHADRTAVHSGGINRFLRSPQHFHSAYVMGIKQKNTESLKFGNMIHCLILEPEKFKKLYVVEPEFTGYTKDGKLSNLSGEAKEKKKAWYSELSPGAQVVEQKHLDAVEGMANAIVKHPIAKEVFKEGLSEVTGYYRDPETGLKCVIRPDRINTRLHALVDLKTTENASLAAFQRSLVNYGYENQNFMYDFGYEQITSKKAEMNIFVAIEKEPPYAVAVYVADESVKDCGSRGYRKAMKGIKQCLETGIWPGYQTEAQNISMPAWSLDRYLEENEV